MFATGGIGGVHRGVELTRRRVRRPRRARAPPLVTVCAGAKAFLDLPRTLEYLETVGVPVLGWRHDWFPAFYARSAGLRVPHQVAVGAARSPRVLRPAARPTTGVLLTVPIPEADELDAGAPRRRPRRRAGRLRAARHHRARPSRRTCSARIAEETEGRSVPANLALAENNARVGGRGGRRAGRLTVRWEALFADLEAQVEAEERAELEAEVRDRTRREGGLVRTVDRLRARRRAVPWLVAARGAGTSPGGCSTPGADWLLLEERGGREAARPDGGGAGGRAALGRARGRRARARSAAGWTCAGRCAGWPATGRRLQVVLRTAAR